MKNSIKGLIESIRDFAAVFIPELIIFSIVLGAVFLFANYAYEYSCNKYEEATGRETKWVFMNDCYINTGEHWLQKDEYLATVVAREGLQSE